MRTAAAKWLILIFFETEVPSVCWQFYKQYTIPSRMTSLLVIFIHILSKPLCAFRKKHSCQSLLINSTDKWKTALDNKYITGAVFMDLYKAFDCLPHGLLIAKCHAYGLAVFACELIAGYLDQRKQRIKIGGVRSLWADLHKGVPKRF